MFYLYSYTLLGKNYLCYMFYPLTSVQFALMDGYKLYLSLFRMNINYTFLLQL